MRDTLANAAFSLAMATLCWRSHNTLLRLADKPESAQANALRAILAANTETEQGRRLNLTASWNADAYRAAVPVHDYEDIRSLVERQIASGETVLAPEQPIMYTRSSGTTGAPKYLPVTRALLAQLKRSHRAMAFAQHKAVQAFSGRILGIGGSGREETFEDGTPAGSATGLIYETMPRLIRAKYVVPSETFALTDYAEKYRAIAKLAACADDITLISTANPSTLLRLMDVIRSNLADIAEHAPPARALALRRLAHRGNALTMGELWPRLRAVVTWLGGGCAIAAEAVRAQLPPEGVMVDAGYAASELRGTIVVDVARNLALPMLGDVFFEFIPVDDWDSGDRRTRLLHEIVEGVEYHVMITTIAGLLRYHMNDVVRVSGWIKRTPTLQFIRKGRGVTNITGEKLSEDQVHTAMASLPKPPLFYIVLADARRATYSAFVQGEGDPKELAECIDSHLRRSNIEYDAKRASRRLAKIKVTLLRPGAAEAYHRHCTEKKQQREAQAKVLSLQTVEEFDFDFIPFEMSDARNKHPVR